MGLISFVRTCIHCSGFLKYLLAVKAICTTRHIYKHTQTSTTINLSQLNPHTQTLFCIRGNLGFFSGPSAD